MLRRGFLQLLGLTPLATFAPSEAKTAEAIPAELPPPVATSTDEIVLYVCSTESINNTIKLRSHSTSFI